MRTTSRFIMLACLIVAAASSATAFDGQRKGKILGLGLGGVAAGPASLKQTSTQYAPGICSRLMIGYAPSHRTMVTLNLTRQIAISHVPGTGQSTGFTANWMWDLSLWRYLTEAHRSMFWHAGVGIVDWGNWGDDYVSGDVGRAWNVVLAGGAGYQFLKGFQVQLDLVAGPAPSGGDGKIKGLLRLELVGMIY